MLNSIWQWNQLGSITHNNGINWILRRYKFNHNILRVNSFWLFNPPRRKHEDKYFLNIIVCVMYCQTRNTSQQHLEEEKKTWKGRSNVSRQESLADIHAWELPSNWFNYVDNLIFAQSFFHWLRQVSSWMVRLNMNMSAKKNSLVYIEISWFRYPQNGCRD